MRKLATVLLHLTMLALVGAIGAYWAIRIMTPAPASLPPPPSPVAMREADPALAARMFGAVQAPAAAAATLNVQALGAFAAGRHSAAVLAVEGKPARVYLLNQEVASGARLVEVRKDAVTIEQGGVRRDFALPSPPTVSLGGSPPPPGFTREGMVLTAPSVASAAQPPAVPPRVAPPRPVPQPVPQPQPLQPQQATPAEHDDAGADGAAARRQLPGRALAQ